MICKRILLTGFNGVEEENIISKECFAKLFKINVDNSKLKKGNERIFKFADITFKFPNTDLKKSVNFTIAESEDLQSYDITFGRKFLNEMEIIFNFSESSITIGKWDVKLMSNG